MYIEYSKKNGALYATVTESVRIGNKVTKVKNVYLGKVIDKDAGIYQSRERGTFTYNLDTGEYGKTDISVLPKKKKLGKEKLILDFGDSYLIDEYMRSRMFTDVLEKCDCVNTDTFKALVMFTMLSPAAKYNAEIWYNGNYSRILYPKADLDSRRISDFLEMLGDENVQRTFYEHYIPFIKKGKRALSVAVDSTGIPNSIHIPITAVSNHNGEISNEVRVIFVTRLDNRMPIFARCVGGNVLDSITLIRTAEELRLLGVDLSEVIIDAGYCTIGNLNELYDRNINFVTRVKPNLKLHKDFVEKYIDGLDDISNMVTYGSRVAYIKRDRCEISPGRSGYVYVIRDMDRKDIEDKITRTKLADEEIMPSEAHYQLKHNGIFTLLSSNFIAIEDILPTYYSRQGIEQFIDVNKHNANSVPARVHSVDAFNGSILVSMIASAVIQSMQNELKGKNISVDRALMELRNQKCKVFDEAVLVNEYSSGANELFKLLGFKPSVRIDRQ